MDVGVVVSGVYLTLAVDDLVGDFVEVGRDEDAIRLNGNAFRAVATELHHADASSS